MNTNIFKAIDKDNMGVLDSQTVELFIRAFLRGTQKEGEVSTDFEQCHTSLFRKLHDYSEDGEITFEDLSKFMQELLKQQIRMLQIRIEEQKYQRANNLHNQSTKDRDHF